MGRVLGVSFLLLIHFYAINSKWIPPCQIIVKQELLKPDAFDEDTSTEVCNCETDQMSGAIKDFDDALLKTMDQSEEDEEFNDVLFGGIDGEPQMLKSSINSNERPKIKFIVLKDDEDSREVEIDSYTYDLSENLEKEITNSNDAAIKLQRINRSGSDDKISTDYDLPTSDTVSTSPQMHNAEISRDDFVLVPLMISTYGNDFEKEKNADKIITLDNEDTKMLQHDEPLLNHMIIRNRLTKIIPLNFTSKEEIQNSSSNTDSPKVKPFNPLSLLSLIPFDSIMKSFGFHFV